MTESPYIQSSTFSCPKGLHTQIENAKIKQEKTKYIDDDT